MPAQPRITPQRLAVGRTHDEGREAAGVDLGRHLVARALRAEVLQQAVLRGDGLVVGTHAASDRHSDCSGGSRRGATLHRDDIIRAPWRLDSRDRPNNDKQHP